METFGDFPEAYKKLKSSKVFLLPVAYDGTSTWLKGADKGPKAIVEASQALEWFDREMQSEPFRVGFHTLWKEYDFTSPEKMVSSVSQTVIEVLQQNKFPVIIGGEHSVTIPVLKAMKQYYDDFMVLQIDAHADLREKYNGSLFNHACVMARAKEVASIVQVGIRSFDKCEYEKMNLSSVFFAEDIVGKTEWHEDVVALLSGKKVYVTIDLDGFDPSVLPATGTPEPGGLDWYAVTELLKKVSDVATITGFDVVELLPDECHKASDFLAAKLIYKLVGYFVK
jgi:agmatinase